MAKGLEVMARWWHVVVDAFWAWWGGWKVRVQNAFVDTGRVGPAMKPVPPQYHQTAADKLGWLCYKYKGTYKILRLNDGVIVLFVHSDGLTVTSSGLASSAGKAVGQLEDKLTKVTA